MSNFYLYKSLVRKNNIYKHVHAFYYFKYKIMMVKKKKNFSEIKILTIIKSLNK